MHGRAFSRFARGFAQGHSDAPNMAWRTQRAQEQAAQFEHQANNIDSICFEEKPKEFRVRRSRSWSISREFHSALGKQLRVYGELLVPLIAQTMDWGLLAIKVLFVVADVCRPLLAVTGPGL